MPESIEAIVFSDRSAEVLCPVCEVEMRFCTVSQVKSVGCQKCRGLLLDGESFATIVRHLRSLYHGPVQIPKVNEDEPRHERMCPACRIPMDNHRYFGPGNVMIDACRECYLVWLDNSELTHIIRAPGKR